jgi:hypothetical protein
MSQINSVTAPLVHNEAHAAAAVRAAMAEVADARTPGELKAARQQLHAAEDKFVKADATLHRAQAIKTSGFIGAMLNSARYQSVARHHLANLERTGFARPHSHVACPHYVSTEARQRATIAGLLGQVGRLNTQLEGLMGRLASGNTASTTGASGGDPDLMNILNDPSLGIEDKIALFMSKYIEKNNQEIDDKMKELAAAKNGQNQGTTANGTATKSGGGWFSSAKSFFKHLGGALPKLAGTVIGGMYGGPAGAALGSKLGGAVGDKIGGSSSSGSSAQANGTQANGTQGAKDQTTLETELQRLVQKREQLVKMLTDLMATLHRTTMSVVGNIKP